MKKIKLHIDEIKPQQHYLSKPKLERLLPFDPGNYGNIYVLVKEKKYFCVDGHHRLMLLKKAGVDYVDCVIDPEDQDSLLYHKLADEAESLGLRNIIDLQNRVLSNEEFQKKWVGKCRKMLMEL